MHVKPLILLTVFIDILGLGIIIPVLPFYVEHYGGSAFVVTALFSVFALCTFLSSPLLGAISDRFGRRPVLIVSIATTAIGWFVFAAGQSLWVLFVGRIIDGLAAGNISTAQSLLSDIAKDDKERTTNLGLVGAMFGIGFIFGPLVGGILGSFHASLPFWFAGGMAAINTLLALRYLPETYTPTDTPLTLHVLNPFGPLVSGFATIGLRGLYVAWFFFMVAFSMQESIFALYLAEVFHYTETAVGVLLTIMGVVLALNQGIFITYWINAFREATLAIMMFVVFGFGFAIMAVPQIGFFIVGMLIAVIGQSTLRVVLTSTISGFDSKRRGANLGTMDSVRSAGLIVGPAAGGILFTYNVTGPFLLAVGSAIAGLFIVINIRTHIQNVYAHVPRTAAELIEAEE